MSSLSAVEAIFQAALEKGSSEERAAYLDEACRGDADLRQQVQRLLDAQARLGGFLEQPVVATGAYAPSGASAGPEAPPGEAPAPSAADDSPLPEGPGTRLGPYKLLQQIGEGGMGAVFMAEQEEPLRRKVALKVIKPGMDSAQVLARFEAERQALALMDHQNIARVLDAGTTARGQPYFVMELVKGVPITKFCDEQHLTPGERLELFMPVCQAIQHAHQKGIIHRDIKPSNVLVTLYDGKPVPKVIDFGVAKAINQRLTERTVFTQFGQVVGTLEYMSPEQAELSALDIDTRSDIYSLGVLLYELLTGSTPLERKKLREAAFTEMLRMIREEEPPKPSTRLSESGERLPSISAQRKMEPAKLTKLLRGELDWIVMKALEKDRGRRYETANGFARDIQRYLADEPVEACPPRAGYKLRKFARKNRKLLATTAAFILLLTAGVVASTWQAYRATKAETRAKEAQALAEERFVLAKEAVDRYLNQVTETPELKHANFHALRKKLLETAIPFYQRLAEQAPGDSQREHARGESYFRLAGIRADTGEHTAALTDYAKARALFAPLAAAHPDVPTYRQDLASSLNNLASMLSATGRPREAEAAYRDAQALNQALANDYPNVPDYRRGLAASYNNLGILLQAISQPRKAETALRKAVAIRYQLATDFPDRPLYRQELAADYGNLGNLLNSMGQSQEAEAAFRDGLAIQQKLAVEFPKVPEHRQNLAKSHTNLGILLYAKVGPPAAEASFGEALALNQKLAADLPAVPEFRRSLAASHNHLALVLYATNRPREAEREHRKAIALYQQLLADSPAVPTYRQELAANHSNFGNLLADTGRPQEAEAAYREAVDLFQKLADEFPDFSDNHNGLAGALLNLAQLRLAGGAPSEARKLLERARPHHEAALKANPRHPVYRQFYANHLATLGSALIALGDRQGALALVTRYKAGVTEPKTDLYNACCLLSNCSRPAEQDATLPAAARRELARTYADQAMDLLRQAVKAGWNDVTHMKKDADLDPLRGRQDFKKLITDLETRQKPTGSASDKNRATGK